MKYKKLKLSAILLLCIGLTGLQAQNTLYVKEKSDTQTPFTLNNISRLTFTTGKMTVNRTDGNSSTYVLNNIRYLNFIDLSTNVSQIRSQEISGIILYPNPVINQLQISYESIKAGNVQVKIVDVLGNVLYHQTISSQNGTNNAIIPVAQLRKGIYICCFQNGDKFETIKFLKN